MKVVVGSDHAGYALKCTLAQHLSLLGYTVDDVGTDNSQTSVDYPSFAVLACQRFLQQDGYEFGLLVCGTGIGISITANKLKGIRCALPQNGFAAQMAREHNNANFIAFGARIAYGQEPCSILDCYLQARFDPNGRHAHRVQLIESLTQCSSDFERSHDRT